MPKVVLEIVLEVQFNSLTVSGELNKTLLCVFVNIEMKG